MLKRGECDIITQIMPESVPLLETVPGIHIVSRPPTRSYFAEINCAKTFFNDPRIRRAMNYAVDMHAVIDILLQGRGEVLPTILLPNAFAYHSPQKPYAYNPELAKKLFAEAGFAEHFPIVLNCTEDNRPFANIIALFLTKVGMRPVITMVARDKPEILGEKAPWDIIVASWGNSTLDPSDILEPKFQTKGQGNYSGYSNEEVDKLLSEAENTLDYKKRELYYRKVQEIIFDDAPMIFGYAADELYSVRDRIKNFIPSPSGMMNMHDVYLETGD